MELTNQQYTTLAAHIRANATPAVVAALAIRNDNGIKDEYNKTSATKAWRYAVDGLGLWDAMTMTQFDSISVASKRELWLKWIDMADRRPVDFGMAKNRNAIADIWSVLTAAQLAALYTKLTEDATIFETVFNSPTETVGTNPNQVSAIDRVVVGPVEVGVISKALNEF